MHKPNPNILDEALRAIDEFFRTAPGSVRMLPLPQPALNSVLDTIASEASEWEIQKATWVEGGTGDVLTGELLTAGNARIEVVCEAVAAAAAMDSPGR